MLGDDDALFLPADTYDEAAARMYSLVGGVPLDGSPGGTRGVRGALSVLAEALEVDAEPARTSASTAEAVARQLDIVWGPQYQRKTGLTLEGFNVLLHAASEAHTEGRLKRVGARPATGLVGPEWADFKPARSKIEAVTRLAALTGAPREWLGPGSKEHKSALLNLAANLFPADSRIDTSSKHRLAASLARVLGAPWSKDFTATGQTIKLTGLNAVLAGTERYLGRLGDTVTDVLTTPEAEGAALAAALFAALPVRWDGKTAVRWLDENGLRGSNDTEWQGFYGEERAKTALNSSFTPDVPGPRRRYGSTDFDYALSWVWDIKVHTTSQRVGAITKRSSPSMLLNDERAVRECVEEQGLGFLVVSGQAIMDDTGAFKAWHDDWKRRRVNKAPASSNSGRSKVRKSGFAPFHVDAYWISDTDALTAAVLAGQLTPRAQGRQAPRHAGGQGAARPPKFEMHTRRANAGIRVASYTWVRE